MAKIFELEWAFDAFRDDMTFMARHMFGGKAAYVNGRIVMVLAEDSKNEVWNGILLPTEREHHESLIAEYPMLIPHKILPKWLFLPWSVDGFEDVALELSKRIAMGEERLGVVPKPKSRSKKKKKSKSKSTSKKINRARSKKKVKKRRKAY